MPCRIMSASGGHPTWVISITVRSMRQLINCVFWAPNNRLQWQMMPRVEAQFRAPYIVNRHHSNYIVSIAWFVLALSCGTSSQLYGFFKTYDETLLLWDSTNANSLTTSSQSRHSKNVKSISKTLQTDNRERPNLHLYLRLARLLLLLQLVACGTLSKLSAEQAHCRFIVAGVASKYKHVHEWLHRLSPGSVEGVDAAVVTADFRSESL